MALEHPWTAPPEAAATIEVAGGIRWLRMPLPFQLDHINLWLLADGDAWTAVDTGVALPPTRERWEHLFAHGLDGKPIRRVLVTHFHPDHIGNAAWLTERWMAPLWCTQTEWLAAEYALRSRDDADLDRRVVH
jgi:glyoxylase-like metal-dependent hydrolase (beta-lactamase superfamily II)